MKQGIPKSVRDELAKQAPPEEHLSADLLSGYVEHSLTAGEKTLVMNHLAACEECREVVFLAAGAVAEEHASGVATAPAAAARAGQRKSTWAWWKWAAPAFAAFIVAAAVLIEHDRTQPKVPPVTREVATVNRPAQSPQPEVEEKAGDLVVFPSRDEKKAAAAANKKRESTLENETYAKDNRDDASRRQGQGQAQTRYWAMQQSQMTSPQNAATAAAVGGPAQSQTRSSTNTITAGRSQAQPSPAKVPPASQTAEVTSGAPIVQADNADLSTNFAPQSPNGKNEPTYNQKPAGSLKSGLASSAESNSSLDKLVAHKVAPPSPQWRITADGHLERAFSGGEWTRVLAEEPVSFRVVSVIAKDVWAGGNDGALFHSSDRGLSWDKVRLTADKQTEHSAVISIRFDSPLQGSITTDSDATWTTTDGGQSWTRQ
jgi:photosynthesis system II assembly factor YCF48-like protein/putative zinc finger protein